MPSPCRLGRISLSHDAQAWFTRVYAASRRSVRPPGALAIELAAFCDMRLCHDDAKFGIPIARLGTTSAYPELEGLLRPASPATARELLLEGRVIGAYEALAKGLVNRVLPAETFEDKVTATIQRIVAGHRFQRDGTSSLLSGCAAPCPSP